MFQYPDQDSCPEDFNGDAPIPCFSIRQAYLSFFTLLLTLPTYYCYYLQENATPLTQNVVTSKFSYLIYVPHCKGIMY